MFVVTSLSHTIKSYKHRDETGMIEGVALFFVFSIILYCAYGKLIA